MIEKGADFNAKDSIGYGWTPLHYASQKNAIDVARLLIEKGADINAKTNDVYIDSFLYFGRIIQGV